IFQSAVDAGRIPGVAAVAYDVSGEVLFSKGYGHRVAGDVTSGPITPQTPLMLWSCTKLVTCVAALQLVEQGKLDLYAAAEKYVPGIRAVQCLRGFEEDGTPRLAKPERTITVLNLFTHTAGFGYDFFDQKLMDWRTASKKAAGSSEGVKPTAMEEYSTPLLFEPGTRWQYGVGVDWLGFIIEAISGLGLAEYIERNVTGPLGLKTTGRTLTPEQDGEFFTVYAKDPQGTLVPTPMRTVDDPDVVPGGHFLYSTTEEYAAFLLTLLNHGKHPKSGVRVLQEETAKRYLFNDMLPEVGCSADGVGDMLAWTVPRVTLMGSFLPGVSKGWSLAGLVNTEAAPNGRSKNSLMWAGLGNCYLWVDPTAGKLGFVSAAVLPFMDKDVLHLADALERAVYGN
ncbi:beta-lactamase/transpeptidase-like protein, partial [Neohortaea acidophila]